MSEWEPATDAEVAMRDALRTDDQESYFRILSGVDLLLPVSADALAGLEPLGWGTWSTGGRTHVLAFTSSAALQSCLADYTGSARRVPYSELANTWPNLEWWLAVNPGLSIEGYLPAWFVAQLSRGDLRLPTRGPGRDAGSGKLGQMGAQRGDASGVPGGPAQSPMSQGQQAAAAAGYGQPSSAAPAGYGQGGYAQPAAAASGYGSPGGYGAAGGYGQPAATAPGQPAYGAPYGQQSAPGLPAGPSGYGDVGSPGYGQQGAPGLPAGPSGYGDVGSPGYGQQGAPGLPAGASGYGDAGSPGYGAANGYGQQQEAASPYGQPAATSPYGQPPATSPYGQPPAPAGYGQQEAASPYGYGQQQSASPYGATAGYGQPDAAPGYGPPAATSPYGQPQSTMPGGYGTPPASAPPASTSPASTGLTAGPYGQPQSALSAYVEQRNAQQQQQSTNPYAQQPSSPYAQPAASQANGFGQSEQPGAYGQTSGGLPQRAGGNAAYGESSGQAGSSFGQPGSRFGDTPAASPSAFGRDAAGQGQGGGSDFGREAPGQGAASDSAYGREAAAQGAGFGQGGDSGFGREPAAQGAGFGQGGDSGFGRDAAGQGGFGSDSSFGRESAGQGQGQGAGFGQGVGSDSGYGRESAGQGAGFGQGAGSDSGFGREAAGQGAGFGQGAGSDSGFGREAASQGAGFGQGGASSFGQTEGGLPKRTPASSPGLGGDNPGEADHPYGRPAGSGQSAASAFGQGGQGGFGQGTSGQSGLGQGGFGGQTAFAPPSASPASSVPTSSMPTSSMPASSTPTSSMPTSSVPTSAMPASAPPRYGASQPAPTGESPLSRSGLPMRTPAGASAYSAPSAESEQPAAGLPPGRQQGNTGAWPTFKPDRDAQQDPKGPLPVRTPMAQTPPPPDNFAPHNPDETPFDPRWSSNPAPTSAPATPAAAGSSASRSSALNMALPRRNPSTKAAASSEPAAAMFGGGPGTDERPEQSSVPASAPTQAQSAGSPLPRRQPGAPSAAAAPMTSFAAFKTPAERASGPSAAPISAPPAPIGRGAGLLPPVIPGGGGGDRPSRFNPLGGDRPEERFSVDETQAIRLPDPVPGADSFVAANDVERELHEAADVGNTDRFLSTLLLATVLVPVADHSRPGSAPGESGFVFRTEETDGEQFLTVFTSKDRLSEHFSEPTRTVGVRFYELIRNWPDPAWSFSVNPGTPVGAKYPGPQVIALASWAAEAGLGSDSDTPALEEAPPVPAPEPASDDAQHATVMQKTLPPDQLDYYLERGYDRVAGFVHRATEVEHLRTPSELLGALGLTYDGSPHQLDAKEAYVLRWPAYRPSLYRIPYGGQNEQALKAMDGWVIERAPFRGNGFAPGESRDVVAEFKVDSVRLPHGAQLWRIDGDGAESMIAVLDFDGPVWRRVGEQQ